MTQEEVDCVIAWSGCIVVCAEGSGLSDLDEWRHIGLVERECEWWEEVAKAEQDEECLNLQDWRKVEDKIGRVDIEVPVYFLLVEVAW